MRVLIVTNMYPSATHPFFGSFVKTQADDLAELGHDISVVSNSNPRTGLLAAAVKYASLFLRALFRGISWRPDIIHVHYIFPTMLPAILLKWILRVPLIVTSHRGDVFDMPFKSRLVFRLTRFCIRQATTVIAVSREIETQIREKLDCPDADIVIIDMGHRLRNPPSLPSRTPGHRLLFIGLSFERKGGFDLLEAIKRVAASEGNGLQASFIGEFPDAARAFVTENKLGGTVEVLGKIPHEEIAVHLENSDIFILPSYSEGLPVSMLEAMSMGLAIIASDVGDIPAVLQGGAGIVIKPGDIDALESAIRQLLTDHDHRRSIAQNAFSRAKDYTSKSKAEAVSQVYVSAQSKTPNETKSVAP